MKYRQGIFIVVYSRTKEGIKYLILERKLHWKGWEFPKGGLKKGEKISDALRRELKEETGRFALETKRFDESGKYEYERELKDRNGFIGQTYILYSAEIIPGNIKLDREEHSGYEWMNFEDAFKRLTWENQKKCLKIVKDFLKTGKMKYREFILQSGAKIFLGKDAKNNEELVNLYKGKGNLILHTAKPGSPFCVIDRLNSSQKEIKESAIICASKSQDWRDNKKDVVMNIFAGKDIYKNSGMKTGTFGVKRFKNIKIRKEEIEKWEEKKEN